MIITSIYQVLSCSGVGDQGEMRNDETNSIQKHVLGSIMLMTAKIH